MNNIMNIKFRLIFFFLIFSFFCFSQQDVATVDIIHFNSTANYGPGSGVSVHVDPKGIYKMGNHYYIYERGSMLSKQL